MSTSAQEANIYELNVFQKMLLQRNNKGELPFDIAPIGSAMRALLGYRTLIPAIVANDAETVSKIVDEYPEFISMTGYQFDMFHKEGRWGKI